MTRDNKFESLTIRDLVTDDEKKLVIFFGDSSAKFFEREVFAGIISREIIAKQKILAMEPEHIRVKHLGKIDSEQAQHNLNELINDTKIDSVDIFSSIYNVKDVFSLLENFNEFKGENIINIDNSCIINIADFEGTNYNMTNTLIKASGIRNDCDDNDTEWTYIFNNDADDVLLNNLDSYCRVKIDRFKTTNIMDNRAKNGILKAICLRSLYKAEKTFGIADCEQFKLTDVPATVVYRLDTEKRHIKYTEVAYLIGVYDMHRTEILETYKCKVSRYSIRDLFFAFIKEWFKFAVMKEMESKEVDLEYVAGNEMSGIFVYSLDTLIEIITNLYNKGIYVSIDINRKDINYYNINNENNIMIPKQLSSNIEVDSFVTANMLLDIDKEIEEAIKKLQQAARIEFNKEQKKEGN